MIRQNDAVHDEIVSALEMIGVRPALVLAVEPAGEGVDRGTNQP